MYEWHNFEKNKIVSEERLKAIRNKMVRNEKLSTKHDAMRQQEHEKINKPSQKIVNSFYLCILKMDLGQSSLGQSSLRTK